MGHAAGYIDLILLHWPRPAVNPRLLLIACRALLRNAGVLVIAASTEPEHRISHLSALGGAAATAGLHLIDHIAAIDPDTATPVAVPQRAMDRPHTPSDTACALRPLAPHTDLLVFSPEAATP
jgi:diketogulonate reductase-like aldo/keto reductase